MRQPSARRRFFRNTRLVWAVLFIAMLAVIGAELSVSRLLVSYGEHAATTRAQVVFAEAVQEICDEEEFSSATSLQTDEQGNVKSFSGNTALQNKLQAQLATSLCEAFDETDRTSFSVPLGTLFGDALCSGRGQSITFYVALAGSPEITVRDEFSDAGINQTYHTVTADAKMTLLITALGKCRQTEVVLSVPVSQTVIVGQSPDFYANF